MRYIACSDIHLGHIKTPTEHIISSFKKSILSPNNKDIDVLFIAGDLFDRLLDLNAKDVTYIIGFFNYLLDYCYYNNIYLRILEGTPSHDWQQSIILYKLNEIRTNKCNLKYHKVLDIEYIDKINKYVLYIPDEWVNTHDELENQIKDKLNKLSITKVDIAILHGQFKYQTAGKVYHGFFFHEEYFLKLVKGYIHVGHYHIHSTFDRIIAGGSLERLAHGEESPKGYILVNDNTYQFIENTDSYKYVTINVTPKMSLDKLDKIVSKYPVNSYIRLLVDKDHEFNINFTNIKLRYLDYNIKKLSKEKLSELNTITHILTEQQELDTSDKYILENNVYTLLVTNIGNKYMLTEPEHTKLLNYIDIFKNTEGEDNE